MMISLRNSSMISQIAHIDAQNSTFIIDGTTHQKRSYRGRTYSRICSAGKECMKKLSIQNGIMLKEAQRRSFGWRQHSTSALELLD